MFVEYDLFGPDILTLNNMNYDKSTAVGILKVLHVTNFDQSYERCSHEFMTWALSFKALLLSKSLSEIQKETCSSGYKKNVKNR